LTFKKEKIMTIETLNMDGKELKVADLSQEIQRLVAVYEKVFAERADVEVKHISLSAALRQLSTDITAAIQASQTPDEVTPEVTTEAPVADTPVADGGTV
jgi:hypothetical protein